MKKAMVLLVCGVVLSVLSSAVAADRIIPQIKLGDKALLFTVNGLGDFGVAGADAGTLVYTDGDNIESDSYSGIGFKTFLADRIALRVGLCYSSGSITTETDAGDVVESVSMLALQPAIEYHLFLAEAVSIYTGGALSIARIGTKTEIPDTDASTISASGLGIAGLLGAEFYPWKNVSFAAEYQLGYSSGSGKADNGTDEVEGPKAKVIGISTFGVTLGIHFK